MSSPEIERELLGAVHRTWSPIWLPGRGIKRLRPAFEPHEFAAERGVKISEDPEEAFAESFEFRKMGRAGSQAIALAHAAESGHVAACLLLVGFFMTRATNPMTENRRAAYARALGWLSTMSARSYSTEFDAIAKGLTTASKTRSSTEEDEMSPRRRKMDREEGKLTVVSRTVGKLKFEHVDGARYLRLNTGLAFSGPITPETRANIVEKLRYEYPWATDLLAEISSRLDLLMATGSKWFSLPPILLVGPPGIGKTRIARRIAELAGVPFERINLGGSTDNRDFAGTSRGWSSAVPTRISEILVDTETPNPLVLLDEIDKESRSSPNGNVVASVLSMLEPETQTKFRDEALGVDLDLSCVNWIATANTLEGLGRPFLSRVRIVKIPAPPPQAAERLVEVGLRVFLERHGWAEEFPFSLDPIVKSALVSALRKGASLRALGIMIEQVVTISLNAPRKRYH